MAIKGKFNQEMNKDAMNIDEVDQMHIDAVEKIDLKKMLSDKELNEVLIHSK